MGELVPLVKCGVRYDEWVLFTDANICTVVLSCVAVVVIVIVAWMQHHREQVSTEVLQPAGIACTVLETEHSRHAVDLVQGVTQQQLSATDGIVAVGGDGLFHEVINGLLGLREGGDERAVQAAFLRVGTRTIDQCWQPSSWFGFIIIFLMYHHGLVSSSQNVWLSSCPRALIALTCCHWSVRVLHALATCCCYCFR